MLPTLSHQLLTRDYNQLVVVSLLLRYQNSLALWDYYCQSYCKRRLQYNQLVVVSLLLRYHNLLTLLVIHELLLSEHKAERCSRPCLISFWEEMTISCCGFITHKISQLACIVNHFLKVMMTTPRERQSIFQFIAYRSLNLLM